MVALNADAQWCLMMFRSLKVGGVWGVPRSGLIFTRTGEDTLALTTRMRIPPTRAETSRACPSSTPSRSPTSISLAGVRERIATPL